MCSAQIYITDIVVKFFFFRRGGADPLCTSAIRAFCAPQVFAILMIASERDTCLTVWGTRLSMPLSASVGVRTQHTTGQRTVSYYQGELLPVKAPKQRFTVIQRAPVCKRLVHYPRQAASTPIQEHATAPYHLRIRLLLFAKPLAQWGFDPRTSLGLDTLTTETAGNCLPCAIICG